MSQKTGISEDNCDQRNKNGRNTNGTASLIQVKEEIKENNKVTK
jgi:hypothetical protein